MRLRAKTIAFTRLEEQATWVGEQRKIVQIEHFILPP